MSKPEKPIVQLIKADIYQQQKQILQQVTLTLHKGEFAYLVGKTGAGKSSLLKTLYGDLPLKNGYGNVAGFDLTQLNWKTVPYLRRRLGIIFQDFHLLPDRNVEQNLLFALEATDWRNQNEMKQQINNVLTNVGVLHKSKAMPFELSGGEQQRIAIARALLNDPILILADEPTGNLDPQTSEEIMSLLLQISKYTDTTVLVGTHDFYTIKKLPATIITCADQHLHYSEKQTP